MMERSPIVMEEKLDFRNVTIIMTTNAGAESLSKLDFGFTHNKKTGDEQIEIK